jgi:hypothetical protein
MAINNPALEKWNQRISLVSGSEIVANFCSMEGGPSIEINPHWRSREVVWRSRFVLLQLFVMSQRSTIATQNRSQPTHSHSVVVLFTKMVRTELQN